MIMMNQRMKILIAYDGSSFEAMGAGLRGFRVEVAEFDPARKLEQARALEQRVGEQVGQ